MRAAGLALVAVCSLGLLATTRGALAQQPPPPPTPASLPTRPTQITNTGSRLELTVAYRDVVDAEIAKKLTNGLPTVITLRSYLFREAGGDPLALAAQSCHVVYDLWDEIFRVQLVEAGGAKSYAKVSVDAVLRTCCEANKIPLAEASIVTPTGRYFVASLVEVNPVSPKMLERIKGWVTRPNGSNAIGPGDSLFGSFVGLFVARVGDADRKLAFRSATFVPPPPPPPPAASASAPPAP